MLNKLKSGTSVVSEINHVIKKKLPANFIGDSVSTQQLKHQITLLAKTDKPVLVLGSTGSGKELVASQLHHQSNRSALPFMDINCSAIAEHLVESELFGHVKGAFTGASGDREGYFQSVGKGTLFLDEIGELPLSVQPKLLRVLEKLHFRPVGTSEVRPFLGTIIAATHRDLSAMVADGSFREDLYYRLSIFFIKVPSLAQHLDDIPALVSHFSLNQPRTITFNINALACLQQQPWPGNIRQLRNLIDRLAVLAESPTIDVKTLQQFLPDNTGTSTTAPPSHVHLADQLINIDADNKLAAIEQIMITRAIEITRGNKSSAALLLGTSRKRIERQLKNNMQLIGDATRIFDDALVYVKISDFNSAIPLLIECINHVDQYPLNHQSTRLKFAAHRQLGLCQHVIEGWLSANACENFITAIRVGKDFCTAKELASLQFSTWISQLMTLDLAKARNTAHQMLKEALVSNIPSSLIEAQVAMANTLFWVGDCREVLACIERAELSCTQNIFTTINIGSQGFDPIDLALTLEGLASFQVGGFARANQAKETLIQRISCSDTHPFNQAIILQGAAWISCLFEDWDLLAKFSKQLENISRKGTYPFYQGIGMFFQGCALVHNRHFIKAEELMIVGYETLMLRNGGKLFFSYQALARIKLHLQMDQAEEAFKLSTHAVRLALSQQDRVYMAELLMVQGLALVALGKQDSAEQSLNSAIATASVMGSVSAQVQITYHLAQLLIKKDKRLVAVQKLTDVLEKVPAENTNIYVQLNKKLLQELSMDI